ncbi:MAG: tRNA (N6-isopentenyl adenosine(37)-C2)-methylthiotransferase MiaB [Solitalea-like symbiont of Tyrophagus putrescentiae]
MDLIKREIIKTTPIVDSNYKKGSEAKEYKLYIETYGCQMNVADSELVVSIMNKNGYTLEKDYKKADVIFINTCSIRENAENRVRARLGEFKALKKQKPLVIGILGCMAERLKETLLEEEKLVDIIAGPDSYRSLPYLLQDVSSGKRAINVFLSREETYADIAPVRLDNNGVKAYISIMRGCNNMCSFCVVPFTRGRERSRNAYSIVQEAQNLYQQGYREVTLLGQNVDSYSWYDDVKESKNISFAILLEMVAKVSPDLRVRFSTSHPKDITEDLLHIMAKYDNICKHIHLPIQSGSDSILSTMNRKYTKELYMHRIHSIRRIVSDCAISTDIITGFCSESEADHRATLQAMEEIKYNYAYMFAYSPRPGTPAVKTFIDNVPEEIKKARLREIISLQQMHSLTRLQDQIGTKQTVLIEGLSKKSQHDLCGRNSQNDMVVFNNTKNLGKGQYVEVEIVNTTSATLIGKIL